MLLNNLGYRGVEYCDQFVCLSVCLSVSVCPRAYLWNRWTDLHEILYVDPLWPWLGPSGGVAIRYVLPVLRMTSRLAVMGRMATSGVAIPGRSLVSMNALFLLCVANKI